MPACGVQNSHSGCCLSVCEDLPVNITDFQAQDTPEAISDSRKGVGVLCHAHLCKPQVRLLCCAAKLHLKWQLLAALA